MRLYVNSRISTILRVKNARKHSHTKASSYRRSHEQKGQKKQISLRSNSFHTVFNERVRACLHHVVRSKKKKRNSVLIVIMDISDLQIQIHVFKICPENFFGFILLQSKDYAL